MRNARVDPIEEVTAGLVAQGVQPPPRTALQNIIAALGAASLIATGFTADEHIPVLSQIAKEYNVALTVVIAIAEVCAGVIG